MFGIATRDIVIKAIGNPSLRLDAGIAVVVDLAAAGGGKRFGTNGGRKKQFIELAGRPLLFWSLDVFSSIDGVQRIIVVSPKDDVARVEEIVRDWTKPRGASSVSLTID